MHVGLSPGHVLGLIREQQRIDYAPEPHCRSEQAPKLLFQKDSADMMMQVMSAGVKSLLKEACTEGMYWQMQIEVVAAETTPRSCT